MTDPSGHFGVGSGGIPELMSVQNIIGVMARAAVPTLVRIPGQIAARGFMKWAWISGGIGAGVATLMSDTDLGMEIQVGLRANPTGSAWAYENEHCTDFAKDAEKVFRERGEAPQRITYDSFRPNTREGRINARQGFGYFGIMNMNPISQNGHHEGVLVKGRVYDNNVPFGVPRVAWEEGYEVSIINVDEMTIGDAHRLGHGTIKVK